MCDCIFCKIANHEIPSTVVYEDDQVIAFDDLNPQAPVHTLVIPKKHYSDIADNVPAETMGAMARAIQEVAKVKGLGDGFRVISNKGVNAGQTVMHFHMHVLGGKNLGENSSEDAQPVALAAFGVSYAAFSTRIPSSGSELRRRAQSSSRRSCESAGCFFGNQKVGI